MTFERRFRQVTLNNPPGQRRDVVAGDGLDSVPGHVPAIANIRRLPALRVVRHDRRRARPQTHLKNVLRPHGQANRRRSMPIGPAGGAV